MTIIKNTTFTQQFFLFEIICVDVQLLFLVLLLIICIVLHIL